VQTASNCAPKVKCCKITLPKLCLPKLCLPKFCQKRNYCPPPVAVACATPVYYAAPAAYTAASPQASGQR
jgi:hypothetical protein